MEVRRLRPDEWPLLRELRLRALAQSPEAFSTTHAEALARPDAWWAGAAAGAQCDAGAFFVACEGGEPLGMAGARREGGAVQVVQIWIDPARRRCGAARALLDAVRAFAGGGELRLGVDERNLAARRAYRACGFVETGARVARTHAGDPPAREMRLAAAAPPRRR